MAGGTRFVVVGDALCRVAVDPADGGLAVRALDTGGWTGLACPDFSEVGRLGRTVSRAEAAAAVARIAPGVGLDDPAID